MDIRKIKTLIEMLEDSNLNEIEVSQGEESVRISKGNRGLRGGQRVPSLFEESDEVAHSQSLQKWLTFI